MLRRNLGGHEPHVSCSLLGVGLTCPCPVPVWNDHSRILFPDPAIKSAARVVRSGLVRRISEA